MSTSAVAAEEHPRSPSLEYVAHFRTGPPPFNTPADFIIRTPQGTDWHVSAALLSYASPFFRDLVREPTSSTTRFVLEIPESDAVLEALLRFAYPGPDPVLHDLDDVTEAYAAAQKYQLGATVQALERAMLAPRFTASEPLRVYAVARRLGLEDIADAAAFSACKTPPAAWPFCEELAQISAAQYHELLVYHRRRGALAVQALQTHDLGAPCARCGKPWAKKYRSKAGKVLLEAPADVRVFEVEFVAKLARDISCKECSYSMLQALRPDGSLSKLKAVVERLPLSVVSEPSGTA
ncbi:BTB domain-containing protein [Phanerochaete sordida]|uniref:BTB domain-containing protein n=1 Tax=Phanerochaete sordida TaxID=48140 RepID=A0A9P3GMY0_9APHY|nr:BTB domain-containing protein [Phanerochaete sordida]